MRKVIPSLLITNLENTGLFKVSTWERMRDVLGQMGRKGVDVVDGDAGFAFCRREGVAFIVVGSFSRLGETFVTEFKLLDPDSRKIVKTAAARGTGEDSILNAHIDELSRLIAQGMGVAGQKLDATRMAVAEVTTHSTEAYAAYLQGREQLDRFDEPEARKSFERAVALDPEFAIAYVRLAQTLERDGDTAKIQAAYRKAKELSARAPEKERLLIEARYAWRVERDNRKAIELLRTLVAKYPSEKEFHFELGGRLYADPDAAIAEYQAALALDPEYGNALNSMAFALVRKSDFAGAQTALERYVAVAPNEFNPLDSLGLLLFLRGRYDEAIDKYKKAMALNNQLGEEAPIGYMTALKEDYAGALAWLDRYMTNVYSDAARAEGPVWQGIINYLIGRRTAAFERFEAGLALARSSKSTFREGLVLVMRGFVRSDMGQKKLAREDFDLAGRILEQVSTSSQIAWRTGKLYMDIRWGDPAAADKVMAELDRLAPPENLAPWSAAMRRSFLILMYLGRGEEEAALREAALPRSYEIVNPNLNFNLMSLGAANSPLTADGIAQLLARRGQIDKAIEEYRLLMTTGPGTGLRRLINPIYHFRVAGLYEKKGDKAKAVEHYRKFLEIWKNADPDLPGAGLGQSAPGRPGEVSPPFAALTRLPFLANLASACPEGGTASTPNGPTRSFAGSPRSSPARGSWPFSIFFYFFLIAAPYTIINALRTTNFVFKWGVGWLPVAYLLAVVATGLVVFLHSRLQARRTVRALICPSLVFFAVTGLLIQWLLKTEVGRRTPFVDFFFWIWASVLIIVLITGFWMTVNEVYNPRQARRLIFFLNGGGILGSVFGGLLVVFLSEKPLEDVLMPLACAMLIGCVAVVGAIFRLHGSRASGAGPAPAGPAPPPEPRPGLVESFREVRQNRFLALLAAIVAIGIIVSTCVEFQFLSSAYLHFTKRETRCRHFSASSRRP